MEKIIYLAVFILTTSSSRGTGCPTICKCPMSAPVCPPGVNVVADRCGCCKVCAAQLNQDCGPSQPCDYHKGLECNYGNGASHENGICRARLEGRTCEFNGMLYQNGESFQAGCKHHCTCVDGRVGCMPLCPALKALATPSCPAPHLVKAPWHCCPSLQCHKGAVPLSPAGQPLAPYPFPYKENQVTSNELLETGKNWDKIQTYELLGGWRHSGDHCVIHTTDWSQCSRRCGMGVSSRVTNDNTQCKLVKETLLCITRPCGVSSPLTKKVKNCSRTHRAPWPVHLSYGGCRSVQAYRPNYCRDCADGRCCSVSSTFTMAVLFSCADGVRWERDVTFVRSCECSESCDHTHQAEASPRRWLTRNVKKFVY